MHDAGETEPHRVGRVSGLLIAGTSSDAGKSLITAGLCRGLHRRRSTQPQSELDAVERKRNLRGAFIAAGQLPAHVVLLDDVMTTGATLHAAALTLHRAGVQRVDAWVCARVP